LNELCPFIRIGGLGDSPDRWLIVSVDQIIVDSLEAAVIRLLANLAARP
jgi:hypothetical protein